jgi:hypothetical protein
MVEDETEEEEAGETTGTETEGGEEREEGGTGGVTALEEDVFCRLTTLS